MKVWVCYKPTVQTDCAWKYMVSSCLTLLNMMWAILGLSIAWHCVIYDVLFYDPRQ